MSSSSSSSLSSVVCHHFSLDQIKDATNNFDVSNILGHGGEGTVYLGHIAIGRDEEKISVAVKHLNPNSIEFEKEIKIVSKIKHPNLVSLLGYCNELDQKILVYEYMQKGSLSDYVKKKISICLSWKQRLIICLGSARGLQYLHTATIELPKGIIHRDMKPANILLDKNWVAKVSDFGMFKLSHADQTNSTIITDLKGTCGYYAPEYFRTFQITRKIDVYAFGVVLFEMLCRKKPWDRGDDESYYVRDDEDLGIWAMENADTEINGEISDDSLEIFTDIVGRSLRPNPGLRPTMDEVVLDLERALKCQEREDHEGIRPKALSGRRASVPSSVQKLIQDIKKITGNSEDEIYAMLKECSMEPYKTIQKLLEPTTRKLAKFGGKKAKVNFPNKDHHNYIPPQAHPSNYQPYSGFNYDLNQFDFYSVDIEPCEKVCNFSSDNRLGQVKEVVGKKEEEESKRVMVELETEAEENEVQKLSQELMAFESYMKFYGIPYDDGQSIDVWSFDDITGSSANVVDPGDM